MAEICKCFWLISIGLTIGGHCGVRVHRDEIGPAQPINLHESHLGNQLCAYGRRGRVSVILLYEVHSVSSLPLSLSDYEGSVVMTHLFMASVRGTNHTHPCDPSQWGLLMYGGGPWP